jgi:hypothetical protein
MTNQSAVGAGGEPAVPTPRYVDLARWLWIAGAVVGFARSLVELSDRSALVSALRRMAPQLSQEQVDSATNIGILSTVVGSLAILALYIAIATRMARGRQWARVVIALLGGLKVFSTVLAVAGGRMLGSAGATQAAAIDIPVTPVDVVFSVVVVVVNIATLVLLFHPASNRFFRESAKARQAGGAPSLPGY